MIYFIVENSGTIGLVLFFIFFTGTILKLYLMPGAKEKYDNFGKIPFAEDNDGE